MQLVVFLLLTACGILPLNVTADARSAGQYLSPKLADGRQRAFPTAEGFGAAAIGGRGGKVFYVTNTNESGSGSLRACVEARGPRTCIFRQGGTIILDKSGSLAIKNPFITIAGETTPGGGIAIRNSETQIRPSIEILTHDVIIRYLRLRPGPHSVPACCAGALGLYTPNAHDIILDHVSASWGSDETIDSEEARNFTLQWSLIGEPLLDGGPGKHGRARNALFTKAGSLTVHHTLFAAGQFRNPQIKMSDSNAVADIVNNVLYSPRWEYVISFGDEWAHQNANVVANYKLSGQAAPDSHLIHLFEDRGGFGHSIYASKNIDEDNLRNPSLPERLVVAADSRDSLVRSPFPAPAVRTTSADAAYIEVLARAGATLPSRDVVDTRLVAEVRGRSGRILKHDPEDVGGWPNLSVGEPYPDDDEDGMSNRWELAYGLNPRNAADARADRNRDGWTNLEEFLHSMAGDPTKSPTDQ